MASICQYHISLQKLGVEVDPCQGKPAYGWTTCHNHINCRNCGILTSSRSRDLCIMCKCSKSRCKNIKLQGDETCGKHTCPFCGQNKETNMLWCQACKCITPFCNKSISENGYYCKEHACTQCDGNAFKHNDNCPTKKCACVFPACHKQLINKFTCETHECPYCKDYYEMATPSHFNINSYWYHRNLLHIEIEGIAHRILSECPNEPIINCTAKEKGYDCKNDCEEIIRACENKDICEKCNFLNSCEMCHKNIRSLDSCILELGKRICDGCAYKFKCLNCTKECAFTGKYILPELCTVCFTQVHACTKCRKVFRNDSPEYSKLIVFPARKITEDKFYCAECIAIHGFHTKDESYGKRAGMLAWKASYIDFHNYIKRVYERKNNKIKFNLTYDLVIHLLWNCPNGIFYYKTLRLLTRDEHASDSQVIAFLPNGKYSGESNLDNLLGLFVRCATLPHDLFYLILKMI